MWVLFWILLLFIISQLSSISEYFTAYAPSNILNPTKKLYLGSKSKCFSCEKDLLYRNKPTYLAQPTKCFNCEAHAVQNFGAMSAHVAQSNKCFSCETQYQPRNPFKKCDNNFGKAYGKPHLNECNKEEIGLTKGFGGVSLDDSKLDLSGYK